MRCDAARPWPPPPTRAIERTSSVAIIIKSKRQGQRGHDDSDACARANRTRRRKSRRARARARGTGPRTGPSRQAKPVLRCASRVRKSSLGTPPPPFVRLAEDESQDGRTDGRTGRCVAGHEKRTPTGRAHGGLVTWRSVRIVQGARAYCTYDTTPCGGHSS